MGMLRARWWCAGALALGAAACSITTSTDGFSSGGPSGDNVDAGRDVAVLDADDAAPTVICDGGATCPIRACSELSTVTPRPPNGIYFIDPDGASAPIAPFRAYCEMENDGGGWTLLLKVDGGASTFSYESERWTDDAVVNPDEVELDLKEAKLAGFSTMPFKELRIGLERTPESAVPHFMVINDVASTSLRDLFRGPEKTTQQGRSAWIQLVDDAVAQNNCNAEGVNLIRGHDDFGRMRVGIIFNNESDCTSPDSFIGIGGWAGTGNYATTSAGKQRNANDFGYIMIR